MKQPSDSKQYHFRRLRLTDASEVPSEEEGKIQAPYKTNHWSLQLTKLISENEK